MALASGTIGQFQGPFTTNTNILNGIGAYNMTLRICVPKMQSLVKYINGVGTENGVIVALNQDTYIQIPSQGIYELDIPIYIYSIAFPYGAPNGTLIDYVIE